VDLVNDGVPTAVRREALDAPGQLEGHGRPVTALRCRQSLVVQANLRTPPDAEPRRIHGSIVVGFDGSPALGVGR
jgi:hypothetical protein